MIPSVLVPIPSVPPLEIFVFWHERDGLTGDGHVHIRSDVVLLQFLHVVVECGCIGKIIRLGALGISVGVRESAGINRLETENERVLQRKPSQ